MSPIQIMHVEASHIEYAWLNAAKLLPQQKQRACPFGFPSAQPNDVSGSTFFSKQLPSSSQLSQVCAPEWSMLKTCLTSASSHEHKATLMQSRCRFFELYPDLNCQLPQHNFQHRNRSHVLAPSIGLRQWLHQILSGRLAS